MDEEGKESLDGPALDGKICKILCGCNNGHCDAIIALFYSS